MVQKNSEKLPNNPIEAQGILIKEFYKKFGNEALPIIESVCGRQGRALGLKVMKKLPDNKLTTVAHAFSKSFNPNFVKIISVSDEKFQIQGTRCPFGLENTLGRYAKPLWQSTTSIFVKQLATRSNLRLLKPLQQAINIVIQFTR
ncbi:MAG: hypothetical protein CEE42_14735 [Promethearchaeota archaeon Loki_b31]|nr:MAG: hypothetical protein CEE42_14735 [Candidatus Lokiarchaeota archaeon Loki_b31]